MTLEFEGELPEGFDVEKVFDWLADNLTLEDETIADLTLGAQRRTFNITLDFTDEVLATLR